jgi:hypothetical protein
MAVLEIVHDTQNEVFKVVNIYDGMVIGEFYSQWDAEDFAADAEIDETHRVITQYT